jgi:hypothetical protein
VGRPPLDADGLLDCAKLTTAGNTTADPREVDAMWDALWRNGKVATLMAGAAFGLIEAGAVAAEGGLIAWVGVEWALPVDYLTWAAA